MQAKIADMYTHDERVPRLRLRGRGAPATAAQATRYDARRLHPATPPRSATWMALEAIQALGGNGYINDYPAGRLLRDAKLYEIGAGTSEIRRMLIGRELFARRRAMTAFRREVDPSAEDFHTQRARTCAALVDELQAARRRCVEGRRRGRARASTLERGKLLPRERVAHAARSRHAVPRVLAARRPRHVRRRRARRGHRSPASAASTAAKCVVVANDATVKGGTYYPDDGEEAPARAGDRARESPALRLSRRLRRRVPAAAGRGVSGPRAFRPHLLQPGAACRPRASRRSRW